jgi:hypothetical protein
MPIKSAIRFIHGVSSSHHHATKIKTDRISSRNQQTIRIEFKEESMRFQRNIDQIHRIDMRTTSMRRIYGTIFCIDFAAIFLLLSSSCQEIRITRIYRTRSSMECYLPCPETDITKTGYPDQVETITPSSPQTPFRAFSDCSHRLG